MQVSVLGSGSKGNTTYIETPNAKILVDAGVSFKQTIERLKLLNRDLNQLDAILITHEHRDHVGHLKMFLKNTQAILAISPDSLAQLDHSLINLITKDRYLPLVANTRYQIKDLSFIPIPLSHDTDNIFGFLFKSGQNSLAYLTDTGVIPHQYNPIFKQMDMIIVESNHDLTMLKNSNRPAYLKARIASKIGHLSNDQCFEFLNEVVTNHTKIIVLAHLSEECNLPQLAYETNRVALANKPVKLYVASQRQPTCLFNLKEVA